MSSAPSNDGAVIIPFPGRREEGGRKLKDEETRGTVLLFTGIRYERDERETDALKPASTRRKRI